MRKNEVISYLQHTCKRKDEIIDSDEAESEEKDIARVVKTELETIVSILDGFN